MAFLHSLNSVNAKLTIEHPVNITSTEMIYKYTAPMVSPVPTTNWSYSNWLHAGYYFTTEAADVADEQAIISSRSNGGCSNGTLQPNGSWTPTSNYFGVSTQETRPYLVTGQEGSVTYPTPHCVGIPDSPDQMYRSRNALCPTDYSPTSTAPHCYIDTWAVITGHPLPCCESTVGNPIDASNGDKSETVTDYAVGGLAFTRYYHSATEDSFGGIGVGWTHNFNARIVIASGAPAGLIRPSGVDEPLKSVGTNAYISRTGSGIELKLVGSNWVASLNDGVLETYDATGVLLSINNHGHVITLSYLNGVVSGVHDDFGHALTFNYTNGLLTSLTDPAGNSITYSYDLTANNLTGVSYADGTGVSYLFENSSYPNHLTGILDESGTRYATFGYDSQGRATSTQHAGGADLYSLSYGSTSTTVTTPLGTSSSYSFTSAEDLARKQSSYTIGGLTQTNTIPLSSVDFQRRVTDQTDANGNVTHLTYDSHHLLSKTEAYGTARARVTSYQYLSNDTDLPTLITEPNRTTSFTYDAAGNVLTRTVTDTATSVTRTWTRTYSSYGQVLTEDGPRTDVSDVTTYTYYTCATGAECGQVHAVTNALGQVTTFNTYNAHGQPLTITDPNGVVTTLTYDARERLTSRQVGTETTSLTYWPTGLLKKVTLPDSSFLLYTYDNAHRLTQITDGDGNYIAYTLDAMGNRTGENAYDLSNALSRTRTQVFNSLNQLWKQVGAAGTVNVTTAFGYDTNGNQTSVTAPLSRNTANQFDELNRLKQITDPASGVTQFAYDANDNLTSVVDPRSLTTSYTYNGFGDLTQQVSPDTGTSTSTYDSGGNLATRTDARSKTGTYSYDALNRVTSIAYPDLTTTFTYDAGTNGKGHLTGASDANHTLAFTYDEQGRVTGKGQTVGAVTKSVGYGYTNGDITLLVTPSGQTITYGYTEGRVTSITLNGSTTILNQVLYEPFGPIRGWSWGNSTIEARTYDLDGKPTDLDAAGSTSYAYDDAFRITGITDNVDSAKSWTYGYDVLDRLNSATKTGQTIGYSYDANGNRLTQTGTATATYTVSGSTNRISSISGTPSRTYTYDAAGSTGADGTKSYTYNDAGRLASVTQSSVTTSYVLNALGQRIRKTDVSLTRLFVYDEAGHLLGEYDGSGTLIQETVWLNDIPIATIRPNGAGVSLYFVHTDHLNTPRRITRPSDNAILWRWDSDPFGTTAPNEDPDGDSTAFVYNLRYPGQYFDAESGISYNYMRDGYDPAIGRYTQSDPIGLGGGVNTYVYALANPILRFDDSGLTTVTAHIKEGYMVVDPELPGHPPRTFPITSGRGECMNNPKCQESKNRGPIPPGLYQIRTTGISNPGVLGGLLRQSRGDWGDWRVPLHPRPRTNTYGRSGFFMHGGKWPGSAGCIDIGGGFFGSDQTDEILNDLLADPDGIVTVFVN